MKGSPLCIFLALGILALPVHARKQKDSLCDPLREFAASIGPDEKREIVFSTSWGENFKGESKDVLFAKQCVHGDHGPARKVCDELMGNGSVEFGNYNAMRAITCLAPETEFGGSSFERGDFSLDVGNEDRGAHISISFDGDKEIGGMTLRITAEGY
ncbi:hypothetical protein [Arenimonas sp.]|uniref:hypothetical protein n=1 Tax=Arenimonas sp. TaxID=1872635 RepID=UPI0039E59C45